MNSGAGLIEVKAELMHSLSLLAGRLEQIGFEMPPLKWASMAKSFVAWTNAKNQRIVDTTKQEADSSVRTVRSRGSPDGLPQGSAQELVRWLNVWI